VSTIESGSRERHSLPRLARNHRIGTRPNGPRVAGALALGFHSIFRMKVNTAQRGEVNKGRFSGIYRARVDCLLKLVIIKLGCVAEPHEAKERQRMIVCHCRGISDREIRRCVRAGEVTVGGVSRACGAATGCGGCKPLVGKIVEAELEAQAGLRLPVLQAALISG
jgi:bacterioferritin-associated ferredoxin